MNQSSSVLQNDGTYDSEPLVCTPPTSGPGASRYFKYSVKPAGSCRLINFSRLSDSANMQKACEVTEPWIKTANARRGCKRKATASLSDTSLVPAKIFIYEKQISSGLSRLSLDNNNQDGQPDLEEESWFGPEAGTHRCRSEVNFTCLLDRVSSNHNSRLVLYRGLQLGLTKREALPSLFLDEINKPLMQVVLWKPQGGHVKSIIENLGNASQQSFTFRQEAAAAAERMLLKSEPISDDQLLLPESVDSGRVEQQISMAGVSETLVEDGSVMDTADC